MASHYKAPACFNPLAAACKAQFMHTAISSRARYQTRTASSENA